MKKEQWLPRDMQLMLAMPIAAIVVITILGLTGKLVSCASHKQRDLPNQESKESR